MASSSPRSSSEYSCVGIGSTGSAAIPPSCGQRDDADRVDDLGGQLPQPAEQPVGLGLRAEERQVHRHERAAPDELGELGHRREPEQVRPQGELVGGVRRDLAEGAQHGPGHLQWPQHPAADDRTDVVEHDLDGEDDPEVAATTAHRPEQVRVARGRDPSPRPLGVHDLEGHDAVRGQPEGSAEPAEPAAEGEPDDARVRAAPGQGHQPGGLQCGEEGAPLDPGADAGDATLDVDGDVLERAGAQQDGPGEGGRRTVADRLGGDAEAVAGRAVDRGDHVLRVVHGDHGDRVLVDADGPAQAGPVPAGARRDEDASGQEGRELAQGGGRVACRAGER